MSPKKSDNLKSRIRTAITMAVIIVILYLLPDAWPLKICLAYVMVFAVSEIFHAMDFTQKASHRFLCIAGASIIALGLSMMLVSDRYLLGLYIIAAFGYDVSAYFIGKSIGGKITSHRPFPKSSPNKSWEGTIGGALTSIALCQLYTFTYRHIIGFKIDFVVWQDVWLALILVVAAIIGDNICSRIKRAAKIEDSDTELTRRFLPIPGHGGVIDRFMSLFTTPLGLLLVCTIGSIVYA